MIIIGLKDHSIAQVTTQAANAMLNHHIVVYPTDTVYGIGGDALNTKVANQIRLLKGRDPVIPLSVVMKDVAMIQDYCEVSPMAKAVLNEYLPGPFTFILALKDKRIQTSSTGKVGVRIPKHPFTQALSAKVAQPYITTSANLSGTRPLTTAAGIQELFGKELAADDLVIDAGTLLDLPSTVVDLTAAQPKVLRKGVGIFNA